MQKLDATRSRLAEMNRTQGMKWLHISMPNTYIVYIIRCILCAQVRSNACDFASCLAACDSLCPDVVCGHFSETLTRASDYFPLRSFDRTLPQGRWLHMSRDVSAVLILHLCLSPVLNASNNRLHKKSHFMYTTASNNRLHKKTHFMYATASNNRLHKKTHFMYTTASNNRLHI